MPLVILTNCELSYQSFRMNFIHFCLRMSHGMTNATKFLWIIEILFLISWHLGYFKLVRIDCFLSPTDLSRIRSSRGKDSGPSKFHWRKAGRTEERIEMGRNCLTQIHFCTSTGSAYTEFKSYATTSQWHSSFLTPNKLRSSKASHMMQRILHLLSRETTRSLHNDKPRAQCICRSNILYRKFQVVSQHLLVSWRSHLEHIGWQTLSTFEYPLWHSHKSGATQSPFTHPLLQTCSHLPVDENVNPLLQVHSSGAVQFPFWQPLEHCGTQNFPFGSRANPALHEQVLSLLQ